MSRPSSYNFRTYPRFFPAKLTISFRVYLCIKCSIYIISIFELACPVVDIYPRHQSVFEGQTANITCTVKGIPRPAISWTFDDGELPPDSAIRNFSNQSVLVLSNTSKRLEGWYTCNASNEAGDAFSNSTLHVLGLF